MDTKVPDPIPSISALKLFATLARIGSFSDSAREAGLSQPAFSRAIRTLEDELGHRLFDRTTRIVSLTPAGEALLPLADRLLQDYEVAFRDFGQVLSGERGRVALGTLPAFARFALPGILQEFLADHPRVDVELHDGIADMLFEHLLNRGVDLAITTPPKVPDERIEFRPLFTDPYVLLCAEDHPVAATQRLNWSVFAEYPFVALAPGTSVRLLTDAAFARAGTPSGRGSNADRSARSAGWSLKASASRP